jgi:hypothetical protein
LYQSTLSYIPRNAKSWAYRCGQLISLGDFSGPLIEGGRVCAVPLQIKDVKLIQIKVKKAAVSYFQTVVTLICSGEQRYNPKSGFFSNIL